MHLKQGRSQFKLGYFISRKHLSCTKKLAFGNLPAISAKLYQQ